MCEQLLTTRETAKRLGISADLFRRYRAALEAQGLQAVPVGVRIRNYREASVNTVIRRAAETGDGIVLGGKE